MFSKKALGLAGLAAMLLSRSGRSRIAALPASAQQALRRRRTALPKGVEEFPTTLVDRRHTTVPPEPVAAAQTPTEIVAEYYQEHPSGS